MFDNPIAPKGQKNSAVRTPWDFKAPQYDQRSSSFINAGTDYGVGHTNPIGHDSDPKQHVPTLPMEKHNEEV